MQVTVLNTQCKQIYRISICDNRANDNDNGNYTAANLLIRLSPNRCKYFSLKFIIKGVNSCKEPHRLIS